MSVESPKLFDDIIASIRKELLFCLPSGDVDDCIKELDKRRLCGVLREKFIEIKRPLVADGQVIVEKAGSSWNIRDGDKEYTVRNEKQSLRVYCKRNLTDDERVNSIADTISTRIDSRLKDLGTPMLENRFGWALVRLFSRLSELIIERLEQAPEKHFLTFLDRAGVDLLPPRPAETDLTFDVELKPDAGFDSVLVPKDTQVATLATEAHPEIIFETQKDLTAVANTLQKCIVVDPIRYADRTSLVNDVEARAFRVFEGTQPRERVLYLAADKLFDFSDDASRLNATITLHFTLCADPERVSEQSTDTNSSDKVEVRYWNGNRWQPISKKCVDDGTKGFLRTGNVVISNRPLFFVDTRFLTELDTGELSETLQAQFIREGEPLTAEATVTAPKAGSEWVIEDAGTKYFIRKQDQLAVYKLHMMAKCVVGPPKILDGFLFSIDARPFTDLEQEQFEKELKDALSDAARYQKIDLNEPLAFTYDVKEKMWELKDSLGTLLNVAKDKETSRFNVTFPQTPQIWLALALIDLDEPREFPAITRISGEKSITIKAQETAADMAFSALPANSAFIPIKPVEEFFLLGPRPAQFDAFYLKSDEAFSKPGAEVCIYFEGLKGVPEDAESEALKAVDVVWEYFGTDGWTRLGSSKRREYLFSLGSAYTKELNSEKPTTISKELSREFERNNHALNPPLPKVKVIDHDNYWQIVDGEKTLYTIRSQDGILKVYRPGAVTPSVGIDGFVDTTEAFTAIVDDEPGPYLRFQVPSDAIGQPPGKAKPFQPTKVNEVDGYWIRGCLVDGGYEIPAKVPTLRLFSPPADFQPAQYFAPLVKRLRVCYSYDSQSPTKVTPVEFQCLSVLDNMLRVHTPALKIEKVFHPFSAKDGGPTMYIGWEKRFPAGKQIDLLLDVEEQDALPGPTQDKEECKISPRNSPCRNDILRKSCVPKIALDWEYWSGRGWMRLEVADESKKLTQRGSLTFVAPPDFITTSTNPSITETDHRLSTEFGQSAFWLRVRLQSDHPDRLARFLLKQTEYAAPGSDKTSFKVSLDASSFKTLDGQPIARYRYRLLPTPKLKVELAPNNATTTSLEHFANQWTVTIDHSVTSAQLIINGQVDVSNDGKPHKYRWRPIQPGETDQQIETTDVPSTHGDIHAAHKSETDQQTDTTDVPYKRIVLNSIRLNNVKVRNSSTFSDTIIGSSSGEREQKFALPGRPVLAKGVQIAVREPDKPPNDEFDVLEKELRQNERNAKVLLQADARDNVGPGQWVRWHRVESFRDSKPNSRHFILDYIVDPQTGDLVANEVRFGDGKFGKIPPAGRNNIKALVYQTQNGKAGNVAVGDISVLRNPKDALANIRSITNPERAVRGSDIEQIEAVKQRGPQTLKHRNQAVTTEGFEWLAKEASSEVRRAYVMPGRNQRGIAEPGWMTIVIVPDALDTDRDTPQGIGENKSVLKPYPVPSLTRMVQEDLARKAVTSVGADKKHIHVCGPEYVRVDMMARILVDRGHNPDMVSMEVKKRLLRFLHPLDGGADRSGQVGWQVGRDVFLSEVLAEIEDCLGVDRVQSAQMNGSIDNMRVYVKFPHTAVFERVRDVPAGNIVATFDNRLRMVLADPPILEQMNAQIGLPLFGFKENDKVALVNIHDAVTVADLEIVKLDPAFDGRLGITLRARLDWPAGRALRQKLKDSDGLLSQDERVRMPLDKHWLQDIQIENEQSVHLDSQRNLKVQLQMLKPKDEISVWEEGRQEPVLTAVINTIERPADRIFVPEGHLVYPGKLTITPAVK